MSLRELPPGQNDLSRWRHLRYVPLAILIIASLTAAVTGFVVGRVGSQPAPVGPEPAASARLLPETCAEPTAEPPEVWSCPEAADAQAEWDAHAPELAELFVTGEDGWVFWGDVQAQNLSQAVGKRVLTNLEVQRWEEYLTEVRTELADEGVEFYFVVAPAKWAVYSQELPAWMQGIRGPGPLDQLVAASDELPLIDLRQPLIEASDEQQTYSRLNSHWSDYGALVGFTALAKCLNAVGATVEPITPPVPSSVVTSNYNEFEKYGVVAGEPDWTEPRFGEPLLEVSRTFNDGTVEVVPGETRIDSSRLPGVTSVPGAPTEESLLIAGDSFTTIWSPWLQQTFQEVAFVRHHFDGDPSLQPDLVELAEQNDSDIVILEVTQRFLVHPPE